MKKKKKKKKTFSTKDKFNMFNQDLMPEVLTI